MILFHWKKKHTYQTLLPASIPYLFFILLEGKHLYSYNSTGKPKGVLHTSAGYLLYAKLTSKYVFDLQEGDKFGCMADIGYFLYSSLVVG